MTLSSDSTISLAVQNSIADVPPVEFSVYVKELHKDCDRGFSQQFTALQAHSPTSIPCGAAKLEKNNRYHNIREKLLCTVTLLLILKYLRRFSHYCDCCR